MLLRSFLVTAFAAFAIACPGPVFAQDQMDLSRAQIVDSPADVASWPVTVHIDRVTFDPDKGLSFAHSGADWPDFTPAGWDGPIQYTVWACHANVCAGFIQMWRDREATGAPLPSNWTFWWGSQAGGAVHQPFGTYAAKPGDEMAFFLTAGNARDERGVTSVRERSQVVSVVLPRGDAGVFDFPISAPIPAPLPPSVSPNPVPPVPPVVVPTPESGVVPVPATPIVTPAPIPVPPPVIVTPAQPAWKVLLEGLLSAIVTIFLCRAACGR